MGDTAMSAVEAVEAATAPVDARHEHRGGRHSRGWLVRRALVCADVLGLLLAFVLADWQTGASQSEPLSPAGPAIVVFALVLPAWIVAAKLFGLYDHDEERPEYSTVDDFVGVLQLATLSVWGLLLLSWALNPDGPDLQCLVRFWAMAVVFVMAGRAFARGFSRRSAYFRQRTLIVGAGATGQLVARKLLKHPEYGLDVIGFVDERPLEFRTDVGSLGILGTLDDLSRLVSEQSAERVIVAFSNESEQRTLEAVRDLGRLQVQIDVVPRLYEVVGPRVDVHAVEGLPLVGLPPTRLSPSSRILKRSLDVFGASLGLLFTAPLFAYIALRVRLDSAGPVLFRQPRLGVNMKEFNALKFRTMKIGTTDAEHRAYITQVMSPSSTAATNGIYKLDRSDAVTPVGRWLRKTSLDELPQLINVLRGDMSLVGPRPCLPYETELFRPHHFERFDVPAGLTGLWQVTARSHSTFGEALDMDVAYVRGWSLGLDLRLIFRTPLALIRQRQATS